MILFLVLPQVLHTETRLMLPATSATRHHVWLERAPQLRVGFAQRARALAPFVREAFWLGCSSGWLEARLPHHVTAPRLRMKTRAWLSFPENKSCVSAAQFLGKWLAGAGSTATIYALWGVRP